MTRLKYHLFPLDFSNGSVHEYSPFSELRPHFFSVYLPNFFHFLFILCSIFFWGRLHTLSCVFISPSHAWFRVLLVAGTQNMIVDLFMDVY